MPHRACLGGSRLLYDRRDSRKFSITVVRKPKIHRDKLGGVRFVQGLTLSTQPRTSVTPNSGYTRNTTIANSANCGDSCGLNSDRRRFAKSYTRALATRSFEIGAGANT